jgi:hypothetical protein
MQDFADDAKENLDGYIQHHQQTQGRTHDYLSVPNDGRYF